MISATTSATAPAAPGRLGKPLAPEDAPGYLAALGTWRDERKAELDVLDQAALDASDGAAFTGDLMLSMALWKAVADRLDLLVATWDSGRVGTTELERLSTLVWGRLDAASSAGPAASGAGAAGAHVPAQALAVSLPEACRLSDALAASLRARLGIDPSQADIQARVRAPTRRAPRTGEPGRPGPRTAQRGHAGPHPGPPARCATPWPGPRRGRRRGGSKRPR